MLHLYIPARELFDDDNQEFVQLRAVNLQLEHSLVSLSKWESRWEKPFLSEKSKTDEETIDYIRCMTITQNVQPGDYSFLPTSTILEVSNYINAPMTATWFNDRQKAPTSKEVLTAELIYYLMIAYGIPMECQKWHLNRLLTLIRVCKIKSQPPKKKGKADSSAIAARNALNDARRAQSNTKG